MARSIKWILWGCYGCFDFLGARWLCNWRKIAKAIDYVSNIIFLLGCISKSGGGTMRNLLFRMIEWQNLLLNYTIGGCKTTLYFFHDWPTTGGVTALFCNAGDLISQSPWCIIGFAGPRIVRETIKVTTIARWLHSAESLLEDVFLDFIVRRKNLKDNNNRYLALFKYAKD